MLINIQSPPPAIKIGYDGENNWRPISFDCTSLLSIRPNGSLELYVKPNGVNAPITVSVDRRENVITWTPNSSELRTGFGSCQVHCKDGTDIGKSQIMRFLVCESLVGEDGNPDLPPHFASKYISPEKFGAKGDGIADDTQAVRAALVYAIENKTTLYVENKYHITEPLLTENDYHSGGNRQEIYISMRGRAPARNVYAVNDFGGITIANGVNLFEDQNIHGEFQNVAFAQRNRANTGSIFYNCWINGLNFIECSVSNIGAFFYNSYVGGNSRILNNRFLTVYYFAKCTTKTSIGDSLISGNYINGGMELNDNACFQWDNYNGVTISNNFIDYYRTIYEPFSNTGWTFEGAASIGNQYQVFRYLYYINENHQSYTFYSNGDTFNHNDPTHLTKLANFTPLTYVAHDGNTYDYPPYIGVATERGRVFIVNANVEQYISNAVFIQHSLTNYDYSRFDFTGVAKNRDYLVQTANEIYNYGQKKWNLIDVFFVKPLETLPDSVPGWSTYYLGERVIVNNIIYRMVYDYTNSKMVWIPVNGV